MTAPTSMEGSFCEVNSDQLKLSDDQETGYVHISKQVAAKGVSAFKKSWAYMKCAASGAVKYVPSFRGETKPIIRRVGIYCHENKGEEVIRNLITREMVSQLDSKETWVSTMKLDNKTMEYHFTVRYLKTGEPEDLCLEDDCAIIVGQFANPNPFDALLKAAETAFGHRVAVLALGVDADPSEYFQNLAQDIDNLNNFKWFQGGRYLCHKGNASFEESAPCSSRLKDILAGFSKQRWEKLSKLAASPYMPYVVGGLALAGVTTYAVMKYRSKPEKSNSVKVKVYNPKCRWDNAVREKLAIAGRDGGAALSVAVDRAAEVIGRGACAVGKATKSVASEVAEFSRFTFDKLDQDQKDYLKISALLTSLGVIIGCL